MKISIREMILVALFAALTAVGAFISIPAGPVPITLQSLFVLLGGIILGSKLGALSQIVYIILGLVGIPIFAGFSGGLQTILKPSFGFLLGFIIVTIVIGNLTNKLLSKSFKYLLLILILGTIILYLVGLPYMYYILNNVMGMELSIIEVFKLGCLLFLPGDIAKAIIAAFVGAKLLPVLK